MTMQWEGFSGVLGGDGFRYVAANISFSGLPIHAIEEFIRVEYRGIVHIGFIRIDPYAEDVIQFHFSSAGDITSRPGDRIVVFGKSISWIAGC